MSRWTDKVNSLGLLEKIQKSLEYINSVQLNLLAPDCVAEHSRLSKVLRALAGRMTKVDPELYSLGLWQNVGNHLAAIENQCKTFVTNQALAQLQQANGSIDSIVDLLKASDSASTVEEFKSVADTNALYQHEVAAHLDALEQKRANLETRLNGLASNLSQSVSRIEENNKVMQDQKTRIDQSITEFQKQFSTAQEKRTNMFAETLKTGVDDFSVQRKMFDDAFSAAKEAQKSSLEKLLKDLGETFDKLLQSSKTANQENLKFLEERKNEVNEIFGAIGSTAFAGNFKTTADAEEKMANVWRRVAIGAMVLMAIISITVFISVIGEQVHWELFVFRYTTVFILALPAVYAMAESSKHRERAARTRKTQLELSSIDAYLVLLPEEERNKIKGKLAEKFFGVQEAQKLGDAVTKKDVLGLAETAVDNLTKAK